MYQQEGGFMNNAYFDANTCNIDDVISTIDELGYVILENAINKNSIKQLHKELEPHWMFSHQPKFAASLCYR